MPNAGLHPPGDPRERPLAGSSAELDELGYRLLLGNTFHLFLAPGEARIAELGGLHRFMGWDGALITDSGGFQVFSLAHGTVADEIKGRRAGGEDEPGDALASAPASRHAARRRSTRQPSQQK